MWKFRTCKISRILNWWSHSSWAISSLSSLASARVRNGFVGVGVGSGSNLDLFGAGGMVLPDPDGRWGICLPEPDARCGTCLPEPDGLWGICLPELDGLWGICLPEADGRSTSCPCITGLWIGVWGKGLDDDVAEIFFRFLFLFLLFIFM